MESYGSPVLSHHSFGHPSYYFSPNSKENMNALFGHMTAIFQSLSPNAQDSGGHENANAGGTSPERAAAVRNETGVLLPPTESQPSVH